MKKLITILFLFCFYFSFAQPISNRSNASITVADSRLQGTLNLFIPRFQDTTAANLQKGIDSCGALIYTYDVAAIWFRGCVGYSSRKWVQIEPSGSPTNFHFWNLNGNDLSGQSFFHYLGTLSNDSLTLITNNTTRLTIPASGIVRSSAATNVALLFDSVNKRLVYGSVGGTTPTWQQTLTAGSTLTGANTITGANFNFTWNNVGFFTMNSAGEAITFTQTDAGVSSVLSVGSNVAQLFSSGNGKLSEIDVNHDDISIFPPLGLLYIDTITNLSTQNRVVGWDQTTGQVGYITLGTGLSLSSGVLSAAASGLTVGTSPIASGTTTRILYDNAGVLGEYTITGSGTVVAMQTSPSFVTSVIGGASFDVFNTTSTTINAFGAATSMTIGGTPTTAITHNYSTNATATATTKTINFGTGGAAGSTTNINVGDADGGTTTINSPTLAIATAATIGGVAVPTISSTSTFTNKRWTARVGSTTSSATPTINTDNTDIYKLTALSAAITSFTSNLSGTPVDGDILEIQITDNGTARAITWGSSFVSTTVTLPSTTVISTTLTVILQYYTTSSYGNNKWNCVNYY